MPEKKIVTVDLRKLPKLEPLSERTETMTVRASNAAEVEAFEAFDRAAARRGETPEDLLAKIVKALADAVEGMSDREMRDAVIRVSLDSHTMDL
jgi:hypothetical protein